jgi:phosphatidylglycerophosphate synthase
VIDMWLAHLLTLSRIPLAGAFWLVVGRPGAALLVLALGAATDLVDGHIARFVVRRRAARGEPAPSTIGEWLDPLCDKTFVLSVLIAVWWRLSPTPEILLAIAARELILVPIAAVYRFTPWLRTRLRYRFRAGILGKAATVSQFVALTALLFAHPARQPLAALAAVVGVLAALHYILRGVRLARQVSAGALAPPPAR